MTFTGVIPWLWLAGRVAPLISGRTILILAGFASLFRNCQMRAKVTDPSPWWDRDVYADRRPFLLARGRILSALRDWFRRRGFLEVETPALQVSPGNETHLHAFATELATPGGARAPLYLHTSPEFACKKLLAAGEPRIFSFARVFRNRERGPLHHPEFTMLEWYRANEPYEALMEDCAAILVESRQGRRLPAIAMEGPHRRSLCRARAAHRRRGVRAFAGIDLLATLPGRRAGSRRARGRGARGRHPDRRRRHLVRHLQPRAGRADRAAARPRPADAARPISAARGGAGAAGRRSAAGAALRALCLRRRTRQRLWRDSPMRPSSGAASRRRWRRSSAATASAIRSIEDFLAALAAMPPASGIALGFDRLVMLATGATRIEQVLWAPVAGDDR